MATKESLYVEYKRLTREIKSLPLCDTKIKLKLQRKEIMKTLGEMEKENPSILTKKFFSHTKLEKNIIEEEKLECLVCKRIFKHKKHTINIVETGMCIHCFDPVDKLK